MRYIKGEIIISEEHDLPLLKHVMASRYITQSQLWRFLATDGNEFSRRSYVWRVKRLADHGFLGRLAHSAVNGDCTYTITGKSVTYLQSAGQLYTGPENGPGTEPDLNHVAHSIGLNAIHLRFLDTKALLSWESETEIRSRNELTDNGYRKDYDAVVTLLLGGEPKRFALEYERSPKTFKEYAAIRKRIESERLVHQFLYLVPNRHLQSFLKQCYQKINRPLYIGSSVDLERVTPDVLQVLDVRSNQNRLLKEV